MLHQNRAVEIWEKNLACVLTLYGLVLITANVGPDSPQTMQK